ncbi:MAG: ABC transporter ATP-binding protein [Draconibacterium sp.]
MKNKKIIIKFLLYLKPYWFKESVLFVLMLLGSLAGLASPYILKLIIDKVFPSKDYEYLIRILVVLFGINILRIAITFTSSYLYTWVSNHIMKDMRLELFSHFIRLPMSFFDKNKTGDILHRINNEVNTIQNIITGSVLRFVNNSFMVIGLTIALCWLNYKLFLIAVIALPFVLVNTLYFQPKIQRIIKKAREKESETLSFFIERFENVKLIKTYLTYDTEKSKLYQLISQLINLNLKNTVLTSTTSGISTFLISFSPLLILYWGGKQVMLSAMTIGSLVAFLQYLNRLYNPLRDLMGLYFDMIRALVSMKRVFEFLDAPREKETKGQNREIPISANIRFENVRFSFDGKVVLMDLNLELKQGKKYALVGQSGCGKSTLINLLCQFYETEEDNIYFGQTSIKETGKNYLRSKIALISQENQLFHDSILENIRYGGKDITMDEVEEAAEFAGIHQHIVSLEQKYDTQTGDKGTRLSGGQKQRIAIARAILKKADIIILDEATSGLDSESEKHIYSNLIRLFHNKTMLFISHRLSTVRDVDEIICMHEGHIIEKGSHNDLIEKRGFYWKLFQNQIEQ